MTNTSFDTPAKRAAQDEAIASATHTPHPEQRTLPLPHLHPKQRTLPLPHPHPEQRAFARVSKDVASHS